MPDVKQEAVSASASVSFHGESLPLESLACDFCGGQNFYPFWDRMRHGLNLPTVLCKTCGLCQTRPRPTETALAIFYDRLYHRFHKAESPLTDSTEYVRRSVRLAIPRLATLKRFLNSGESCSVFEIGAGVGQFQLLASRETSWQLAGIEPGRESFAFCKQKNLNVAQLFVEEVSGSCLYDAIASFHVLEHVPSPRVFLEIAHRLLRPDGLIYLEVPNLARPGGPSLNDFFQFPHLFSFTATTLRNYLRRSGFAPVYVAERNYALTMVAKRAEAATEVELYDVENFIQRMRMLERVYRLARMIPPVSVLKKIRETLQAT